MEDVRDALFSTYLNENNFKPARSLYSRGDFSLDMWSDNCFEF
jgi:hypothetical protein